MKIRSHDRSPRRQQYHARMVQKLETLSRSACKPEVCMYEYTPHASRSRTPRSSSSPRTRRIRSTRRRSAANTREWLGVTRVGSLGIWRVKRMCVATGHLKRYTRSLVGLRVYAWPAGDRLARAVKFNRASMMARNGDDF
eukprot:410622-Pleurochrysis_carterae.AAC.3